MSERSEKFMLTGRDHLCFVHHYNSRTFFGVEPIPGSVATSGEVNEVRQIASWACHDLLPVC